MRLRQLRLVNFCQHQDRLVDFSDGVIAVLGANGSGKSNLLGAVRWLLTGEHPNAGTKSDNVSQYAPPEAPAFGQLQFSHGDVEAVVTRYLRPAGKQSTLAIGDDVTLGDKPVTAEVLRLLGVDAQILNDVCIVGQGDIFGFLAQTPAKRAAAFAKLFRTDAAERVVTSLNRRIGGLVPAEVTPDINAATLRLEAQQSRLARQREQLGATTISGVADEVSRAEQLATAWRSCAATLRQLAVREAAAATSQVEAAEIAARRAGAAVAAAAAEAAAATAAVAAGQARESLGRLTAERRLAEQRAAVVAELAQATAAAAAYAASPAAPSAATVEQLELRLAQLAGMIEYDARTVAALAGLDGPSECPVCRTPGVDAPHLVAECRARQAASVSEQQRTSAALAAARAAQAAAASRAATMSQVQQRIALLQSHLASLPEVTAAGADAAVWEQALRDAQAVEAEASRCRAVVQQLAVAESAAVARQQAAEAEVAASRVAAAALRVTRAEAADHYAAEASAAAVRARQRLAEVTAATRECDAAASEIAALQARLSELRAQQAAATRERQLASRLTAVRDVLHRDAAPRFVAHRNLQRLQLTVNEFLENLGADFRVAAVEGWSFEARFDDGRVQPAERLSGGQKVALALAFRLAVNFSFADLGFLALDEPTAHLDRARIDNGFGPMVDRLRQLAGARGLQCVIVTHEAGLAPLFDATVTL